MGKKFKKKHEAVAFKKEQKEMKKAKKQEKKAAELQSQTPEEEPVKYPIEHLFFQDPNLPRHIGKCDYTYPDGAWCAASVEEHEAYRIQSGS